MKWSARIGAAMWVVILSVLLFFFYKPEVVKAGTPEQAQASNLAVPGQEAELPYAGAIVVVQCRQAVAIIMLGHDGKQTILHMKESTPATIEALLVQAPADDVTEVELDCSKAKGNSV